MSSDRIDTPDAQQSEPKESPEPVRVTTALNANAKEFRPSTLTQPVQLRPTAPEFIPDRIRSHAKPDDSLIAEICDIVTEAGACGMQVRSIPQAYFKRTKKYLDLSSTSSSDLSVLLKEVPRLVVADASQVPDSMRTALTAAGFIETCPPYGGVVMGCEEFFSRKESAGVIPAEYLDVCPVGADGDRVAVSASFSQFVNELRTFKDSIVDVVSKSTSGVLLSSFSTEWDKSFIAKGLVGMPGLETLTTRFHVSNLVAFLQSIPVLELSAPAGEELRVRLRAPLSKSKSVVVLDDELFGSDRSSSPVIVGVATEVSALKGMKQHISPSLVAQLLSQVERQVLELGSHLATKGLQTSSSDLVLIRLQLQQLQSLKTSLQGVLTPLPPPSAVAAKSDTAALLTQAAQFAMSAISASKPSSSSQKDLTKDDLRGLIARVIEKLDADAAGVPVSSLPEGWSKMFPSVSSLDFYVSKYGFKSIKSLLLSDKNLVVFYATLPSPQLRVTTKRIFESSSMKHVTVIGGGSNVPLISPASTCSYTSDRVQVEELALPALDLERMTTELLLKSVRRLQSEAIKQKAKAGDLQCVGLAEVLEIVEKHKSSRLLESRRPPPIDTGSGSSNSMSSLIKQFAAAAADALISKSLIVGVNVADLPALWKAEFKTDLKDPIVNLPGVRVVGTKCTLTALSNPGALVASVFSLNDPTLWNIANTRLVDVVKRVISPPGSVAAAETKPVPPKPAAPSVSHAQLSELSAVLFKSIMAGGPKAAKDCAASLKLLAAKDPKAIHEIVASHIAGLQNKGSEEAANAFVSTLVEKGKQLQDQNKKKKEATAIDKLMAQLKTQVSAAPPGLPFATSVVSFPTRPVTYTREDLLEIREHMEAAGDLAEAPEALKNLRARRKN